MSGASVPILTRRCGGVFLGDPAILKTFRSRRITVGVTGGIACYKVASIVSTLAQAEAEVTVLMTEAATRFVAPLTFQALSGRPVIADQWDQSDSADPQHIRLAESADAMLIAPCTMNTLAKLATGFTDDAVSLVASAIDCSKTPVLVACSMNEQMWNQPSTRRNIETLQKDGYQMIEPGVGWQACRTTGTGRLPESDELVTALAGILGD